MPNCTRRGFLQAGAGLVTGLAAARQAVTQPARRPPNLLLLHCDQLSSWALSCYAPELTGVPNYGQTLVDTPHLDRLAREGARLARFVVTSAVCTPSRGCLLTGRYPEAHGAYTNNLPLNRDEITLGEQLKRQGYATGYAGKWHLDGEPWPGFMTLDRSMGFDDCRYMFNRGHWKQINEDADGTPSVTDYRPIGDEHSYTTDYLASKSIDFLHRRRGERFCWVVSFPDPHTPFTVRKPYDTMYRPEDMPVPHTFVPGSKDGNRVVGEAELRRRKAAYCGLVKCLDDNVGRILAALAADGILDDTLVAFTTDHGEYLGEHNLWGKNQWYRTAYQVPFLVRWPGHVPAGMVLERFVTSVDVMPTLLSLMGLPHSGREQGQDASALLRGEPVPWVDEAQIHHSSRQGAGLFTPDWELVLRSNGQNVLYNRVEDPEQTHNLAADPAQHERIVEMGRRILEHHRAVGSPVADWLDPEHLGEGVVASPAEGGVVYRRSRLELDTREGNVDWNRLLTTPQELFGPGKEYLIEFDYRSGGLGTDDSAFYYTLRTGNDRASQIGPVRWRAADGETGHQEQRLATGDRADFALIVGILRRGAVVIENLVIRELGAAAEATDDE